jgi:hypothetical protein
VKPTAFDRPVIAYFTGDDLAALKSAITGLSKAVGFTDDFVAFGSDDGSLYRFSGSADANNDTVSITSTVTIANISGLAGDGSDVSLI